MFLNKKKCYPNGTFLPQKMRVIIIIQLCMAFTLFVSYAAYPFLEELYEIKSKTALYESVTTKNDPVISALYSKLPEKQKNSIEEGQIRLHNYLKKPFMEKISDSFTIIIWKIPPFERAWIFFSILIGLLLLLKIEGAAQATLILPLITLAYGISFYNNHPQINIRSDTRLFPTEQEITAHYIDKPLNHSILEQKTELLEGWRRYLVQIWAKEVPSKEPIIFLEQAKKGEFYFNIARISLLNNDLLKERHVNFQRSAPTLLLPLYLLWNCFFAFFIAKETKKMDKV